MSYSYEILLDRELTVITLSGEVTGETLIDALRTLVDDPAWRPGSARLWDGRGITYCCVSMEEVSEIFELLREERARVWSRRTAFVATRRMDHLLFELFRAKTRMWPVKVFQSMEEAHAWIEGDPGRIPGRTHQSMIPERRSSIRGGRRIE